MARVSASDSSAVVATSLGAGVLATLLAASSLVGGTETEIIMALVLGTSSLVCAFGPALGLRDRASGMVLAWIWSLGGPFYIALTHGLTRPQAVLICLGAFVALFLVGRRQAVAMGAVAFSLSFFLFIAQVVVGPNPGELSLRSEIDSAMGLVFVGAVTVMGHAAASARSHVLTQTRATALRYARWMGAIRDTMLQIDPEGYVVDGRWLTPFRPPSGWRGMHLGDVIPELRGLIGPLLEGAQHGDERLHVRLQSHAHCDVEVRALAAAEGTAIIILRDVTKEREAERLDREVELQRAHGASQTQLLQTGRLAHMGVLAFGVAHEINNPLAYVISNLQYIEDGLENGETTENMKEAIRDASDGARRIRSIVEDIRMFAKADDSDHLELLQLADVASSAVRLLRFELRQRVRLIEEHQESPSVFANPSRLAQGILNLLVNAVQAMPSERGGVGSIVLKTGTTSAGEAFVEVSDDGVGIPEENRRRVFEPFFTTRPIGQGTGLGLSICYGLVRRLGGKVDVESEVGEGSTFRIRLPNGQKLLDA